MLITVREAALLARTSKDTVRRRIRDGIIPGEPFLGEQGGDYLVRAEEWADYLDAHDAPGQAKVVRDYIERRKRAEEPELMYA